MARAVVIGSGFGGLAAAVRLRHLGYDVTVLEALDQPGGRAAVFTREGHTFDAGPTVVTAPYLFEELFQLFGRQSSDYYKLVPVDPFYHVRYADGSDFNYVGEEDRILAEIGRLSPSDVDGYRKLADHSRRIFEIGYAKLADVPFSTPWDMLRVVPAMARLESHLTVYQLVSRYLKDDRLRQAFSFQPLLVGGNPFHTSSIYLLIHWLERTWGVWFAEGGTTAIVKGLVRFLAELQVEVRLSTPVEEILVRNGKAVGVRTSAGEVLSADVVVANADPSFVYSRMIDARWRKTHHDKKVARKKQSMSLFVAYFGTDRTYPDVKHHTIVLGPRYKDLLDDIFRKKVLADDFSLYLHRPTATDPSLAPPGRETFYVLSPVPNNESGLDWSKDKGLGDAYLDKVYTELERRCLPDLRKHLTTSFYVTPDYFQEQLRSVSGAAFGPEPLLTQSAWFRYHNVSEDVGGLYFVGAGTHPGAGLPGVLSTAKVLDRVVPPAPGARTRLAS
ncbi:MAG: phytoene desaturase [Deltaproteobacteria bacterium]|jgi:phytoene desaturase|nr:phytoene desaturase [Deltaproteobacteria bacterium]